MKRGLLIAAVLCVLLGRMGTSVAVAQGRLVGITGNQGALGNPGDETLYDIDVTAGTITMLHRFPAVPDTDAIAYNPVDGLLYRTSGAESYRNDPARIGYRDNQYMQTIDIVGGTLAEVGIFNANSEQFGLPAPFPNWLFPAERRTDAQTGPEFGARGPNEYHSLRDFTWSDAEQLFYGADQEGIFKLTATGQSTFVGSPGGQPKGITFATIGGSRKLFVSDRDGPDLWTIDPATGLHVGNSVQVKDPSVAGAFVSGLLSLTELPETEFLYAINKGAGFSDRSLIAVDPATGDSFPILSFNGLHMADLALLPPSTPPPRPGDLDLDDNVNRTDVALFATYFGTATGSTRATGDFNRDGRTALLDLHIQQINLDQPPVGAAAVPEPATGLLALALLGLLAASLVRVRWLGKWQILCERDLLRVVAAEPPK